MSEPPITVRVEPADDPYRLYCQVAGERNQTDNELLLIVPFSYQQPWLDNQPIELAAVYFFSADVVQFSVVERQAQSLDYWQTPQPHLTVWLAEHGAPLFALGEPLPLQPVCIPKPWGQEIWYTGVERRGVACFGDPDCQVPIPYLLAAMPLVLGEAASDPLILLKILDPLPEEVFGDLYFELHQEKQEVYIVTHIDDQAWPDGVGSMRMGFSSEKIEQATDEAEFRSQFLQRVVAYREVRREIDNLLDAQRSKHGYELTAAVPLELLKEWLRVIPAQLLSDELQLRQEMETYFGTLPLRVGDVVKVPLRVPHSLQHGVRTIEFQTPVYERHIIAFAQKVLTQAHWDTESAVAEMEVVAPALPPLPLLSDTAGQQIEQVVDFDDFCVDRHTLAAQASCRLQCTAYQLLIVIEGALMVGPRQVAVEQAVFLPVLPAGTHVRCSEGQQAVFLVARPHRQPS